MLTAMQLARRPSIVPAIEIRPRPPPLAVVEEATIVASRIENTTGLGGTVTDHDHGHGHVALMDSDAGMAVGEHPPGSEHGGVDAGHTSPLYESNNGPSSNSSSAHWRNPARMSSAVKTGRSNRRHRCSFCSKCFARAEHLSRHERSHRNERPFACRYCDASFTRKDLIKRHSSRHHPEMLASGAEMIVHPQNTANETSTNANIPTSDPVVVVEPAAVNISSPGESLTDPSAHSTLQTEATGEHTIQTPSTFDLNPANIMHQFRFQSLLSMFESNSPLNDPPAQFAKAFTPQATELDSGRLDVFSSLNEFPYEYQWNENGVLRNADGIVPVNPSDISTASLMPPNTADAAAVVRSSDLHRSELISLSVSKPQQSSWQGSFELSETKRSEIITNISQTYSQARIVTGFKMPSCIALERFITTCFDSFLIHMPCIHIPTWRAELAHPSLILGMAALGANYHHERELASHLHRASRLSIIDYMEASAFTSRNRPAWVMQSLVLTMAYGVWSGTFDEMQEALSFEANLANIVRYVNYPESNWGKPSDDRSLTWEEWIEIEEENRTKLVVYSFTNNLNLSFNIPPSLVNSEVKIHLPCTETEWTIATPDAWHEYRRCTTTTTPTFASVLSSLLSASQPFLPIPCSTFGSYIMIHALLQHIWHIRQQQAVLSSLPDQQNLTPEQQSTIEVALQRWQAVWEANAESSLSPRNPHGPLAFNSSALLRLAYVRLCADFGSLKNVVLSLNVEAISTAMRQQLGDVQRSQRSTKAALYAIHALRIPVKLGINLPGRIGSPAWSLQHHLYSFECCLFLSKWLSVINDPAVCMTKTEDEKKVEELIVATLAEVELGPVKSGKSHSAQIMYAWALMFDYLEVWGIISVVGASFLSYADQIA